MRVLLGGVVIHMTGKTFADSDRNCPCHWVFHVSLGHCFRGQANWAPTDSERMPGGQEFRLRRIGSSLHFCCRKMCESKIFQHAKEHDNCLPRAAQAPEVLWIPSWDDNPNWWMFFQMDGLSTCQIHTERIMEIQPGSLWMVKYGEITMKFQLVVIDGCMWIYYMGMAVSA